MRSVRVWSRLLVPLGGPIALLVVFRLAPSLDVRYSDVDVHLAVVSTIAACALTVAVVAARAAARSHQAGPVWLAFGCLGVGVLMLGHGLLTPGVGGTPGNLWVARLPHLAITTFTASLWLAGRPRSTRTSRLAIHHHTAVLVGTLVGLGVLVALLRHDATRLWGGAPLPGEEAGSAVVAAADAVVLTALAVVHWRRWRLGHDLVQHSLVLAAAMSAAAVVSLQVGTLWHVSWWDYHGFLLAGFAAAVHAVILRYRRASAVDEVLTSTFERDPMSHLVEGYPVALRSLVAALEVKDVYTHGHSERTALVSVQLGLRLGLDEDVLRVLARGGYLHDVGKIAIPDAILNKPGALTPDERRTIEAHPELGYQLVATASELHEVLPAVLHHHERWDGTGYPGGLYAEAIPFTARIVAVADVWDALTSDRSYRPGVAPDVALAHIVAGRAVHFDPRVVDALQSLAADWGYARASSGGDAGEGVRAADRCHEVLTNPA